MFWPRSNQKVAPGAKSLVFWVSMFFAGLKDAVLWQRVLGVGNWEVKMPKICRLALAVWPRTHSALTRGNLQHGLAKAQATELHQADVVQLDWAMFVFHTFVGQVWLAQSGYEWWQILIGVALVTSLPMILYFSCDLYITCCFETVCPGLHWLGSYRRGIMDASQLKIQDSYSRSVEQLQQAKTWSGQSHLVLAQGPQKESTALWHATRETARFPWKLRFPSLTRWWPTTRWRQLQSGLPGLSTTIWLWWWLWSL